MEIDDTSRVFLVMTNCCRAGNKMCRSCAVSPFVTSTYDGSGGEHPPCCAPACPASGVFACRRLQEEKSRSLELETELKGLNEKFRRLRKVMASVMSPPCHPSSSTNQCSCAPTDLLSGKNGKLGCGRQATYHSRRLQRPCLPPLSSCLSYAGCYG